ncbi:MAG: hypothetical protein MK197_01500 [Candidatus Poseidoniaceae archaeon]|nr:hypothetical protein [Candidatus Poseidoniaceae archaeon]
MESLRIVLMGKNFELRLVSLVVRARELGGEVILLDLGSSDETIQMAGKVECRVINHQGDTLVPTLAKELLDENYEGSTLLIHVNNRFKLRDMPLLVNRARENWDVHMSFISEETDNSNPQEIIYSDAEVSHLAASNSGLRALSESSSEDTPLGLDEGLRVRVLHSKPAPKVQQRESLATASKFAQLFYWMLESRHPLLLFGIPGIVLFIVGYKLSGDVLDTFSEWNETSVGVGLAVIAVTLMGLFAMMVGLILYIMGKQVKQIQAQYNHWPKDE